METVPPNPFKGLRPYKQEDQNKLFGRDRDLILMKDRIFSARTTLLFAASGVGKTSFLNAKVIPDLKKQCAVVWHNRWTGADEMELTGDEFADDEGIQFWPPTAFFRDVIRKFGGKRREEKTTTAPQVVRADPNDLRLAAEVHQVIALSLRHSSEDPERRLSQVLAGFRKSSRDRNNLPSDNQSNDRCILVLDQFEEVFQYHAYEEYFSKFVKDLCEIINDEDYQVRVVFSMREEFLGELSIFDNKIPDLFTNYYRLRYPDKDEAEDIIRRTCQLSGVNPDNDKLPGLVEDLSKIEKGGGSLAERSTGHGKTRTQVIKRNFVAPPYLQIACERLWNQQYAQTAEKQAGPLLSSPIDISDDKPSYPPFLIDYKVGNGDSNDQEPGGDAQKALRSFCEEKLSAPFLSNSEQSIVARAFGFLVTKQGAKMTYELRSLAEHMDERVGRLKTALEKLSQDDAKILRESRGPDRSYWFELYHDMYANIVDEWKIRFLKLHKKRVILKSVAAVLIAFPFVMLFIFAVFYWVVNPIQYRRELLSFKNNIDRPNVVEQTGYTNAVSAYLSLKETPFYGGFADSLWADVLERRAHWYESANDPSSALLCLLKAALMESNDRRRSQHLDDAELLLGAANGTLLATYCDDCTSANLSPDGKKVLTISMGGRVMLWDADSGKLLSDQPLCDNCNRAVFSPDGKEALTAAPVVGAEARGQTESEPAPRQRASVRRNQIAVRVQVWDVTTQTALTKPIELREDSARAELVSDASVPDSADIQIRTFARVGQNFRFLGVRGNQLYYWDTFGGGVVGPRHLAAIPAPSVSFTFSSNGRYLLATFPAQQPPMLWRLSETETIPQPLPQLSGSLAVALSSQGYLLISGPDQTVQIIELDSGKILLLPRFSGVVRTVGFSPSGEQFFTVLRHGSMEEIRIWKTSSAYPLFRPLQLRSLGIRTVLGPDGRTLLRAARYNLGLIEKWHTQAGNLLGVIKRGFQTIPSFSSDANAAMITSERTARLWGIDSPVEQGLFLPSGVNSAGLSLNGKVLLTIDDSSNLQFWDAESGRPLGNSMPLDENFTFANISGDGKYAAAADKKTIRVWQAGATESIATLPADNASVMAFSTDNKSLAVVDASGIRLWDLVHRNQITLSDKHKGAVLDLALTSDKMISGSDDKTAKIWILHTGQKSLDLLHDAPVTAVALSSDGKFAVTGCENGTLRLWDAETGKQIGGAIKYGEEINELVVSSNGQIVSALTPYWMYLCEVDDDDGLHYSKGALIADSWEPLLSILENGKRLRFVYQLGHDGIQVQDLLSDQGDNRKVFKGDPQRLLDDWQNKLALRIGPLGQIEKMWQPGTTVEDNRQSRQIARPPPR